MKLSKVYAIILNWNHPGDTIACLTSLEGLIIKEYKLNVVVVDNGSTDDSVRRIRNYKAKNFKSEIIENEKNLGFAAGNNIGAEYALSHDADYLFFLNNDTLVDSKCIENLIKASESNPEYKILSPKIYFAKGYEFHHKYNKADLGHVIWSAGGKIDWKNVYAENFGVDLVDSGQFGKNSETDFATGAAMFVKSGVLKKYGLFEERYFLYFEDVELCERFKEKGEKVLFVSNAFVWHKVAQSSGIGSGLNDYFITRNRLMFGMRYAPIRAKAALIKESFRFLFDGRKWQRQGVIDFYKGKFFGGSWINVTGRK